MGNVPPGGKNATAAGVTLAVLDDRNALCADRALLDQGKIDWLKLEDGPPQYSKPVPP
jgi:hypothetical protein